MGDEYNTDAMQAGSGQDPDIELITKPECPLCVRARETLDRVLGELGLSWREVSTEEQPQLAKKYGEEIPVLRVDGKTRDFWVIDANRLRRIVSAP